MKHIWILIFLTISSFAETNQQLEKIKSYAKSQFIKTYPNMNIENFSIKRYTPLPKDFNNYKLLNVRVSDNNLKREKGTLSALFYYGKKRRKVYYHFNIDATVEVLKTNRYIKRGETLTDDIVDFITIKFTNFYQKPITPYYLNRYRARTSLVEGKILTTRHVSKVTTIKRGDQLNTTLRDGGVSVSFQTKAMKDAYIGDVIKVKRNHKSFFKARITSSSSAEVVQ